MMTFAGIGGHLMPFVKRTRAILRSAEFGFFGVGAHDRTDAAFLWCAYPGARRCLYEFSVLRGALLLLSFLAALADHLIDCRHD
jgi:hypothetical protein